MSLETMCVYHDKIYVCISNFVCGKRANISNYKNEA